MNKAVEEGGEQRVNEIDSLWLRRPWSKALLKSFTALCHPVESASSVVQ